jgi:hypothetical protein
MMIRPQAATEIIQSKLLILQSKRLMLNSLLRRIEGAPTQSLRDRADYFRRETDKAQHEYRTAMLDWGPVDKADYWLIAYSRMIEMGNALVANLRGASAGLPPDERFRVATEVESLELLVEQWSQLKRDSMAVAVT